MSRLKSKVAIVFGAGSSDFAISNGAATAITFAREGAHVLCVDKDDSKLAITMRMMVDECLSSSAYCADVMDHAQISAAVGRCAELYGGVDVLHYNVGIEDAVGVLDMSEDSWDKVHAINLRGAMWASKCVIPYMTARGGGAIVNISSTGSKKWNRWPLLSYSTSKAALNQMTKFLAREFAPQKIRSNVILPGLIDSPHVAHLYASLDEWEKGKEIRASRCPMGRQGTPWDIAKAALFLASDDASYITGLELVVDGGLTLE